MRPQFEIKSADLAYKAGGVPIELKELDETGEFEGYGATFGNVDRGKDIIEPGAFSGTLVNRDIRSIKMLRDHDSMRIPGEWLDAQEDSKGLKLRGRLFIKEGMSTPLAQETHVLMKAQALSALSIGYRTVKATYDEQTGVRHLKELELWETSIVPFPMNELATISAVKREVGKTDIERILREAGVPNHFAKLVTVHGFDGAKARLGSQREAGASAELGQMLRDAIQNTRKLS